MLASPRFHSNGVFTPADRKDLPQRSVTNSFRSVVTLSIHLLMLTFGLLIILHPIIPASSCNFSDKDGENTQKGSPSVSKITWNFPQSY